MEQSDRRERASGFVVSTVGLSAGRGDAKIAVSTCIWRRGQTGREIAPRAAWHGDMSVSATD